MFFNLNKTRLCHKYLYKLWNRYNHSNSNDKIRNIGILAHIDAGKTTTTERMLFYSGIINSPGEVHHGNTITDCLAQERDRGITICSSAVSFIWNGMKINLLDTPGHIDFTMEVEQSLSAVDGVVIILDSSAGVEAQTITVFKQAERYRLPKLIFINKMDRMDADFDNCISNLKEKLHLNPVALQLPVIKKGLVGIIDVISLQKVIWDPKNFGREYNSIPLEGAERDIYQEKYYELIDKLSEVDDELAGHIINTGSMADISPTLLRTSIKRATISQKICPVLMGSAYKNIGIQTLMNGVIDYLPAVMDRPVIYKKWKDEFIAKVFKVMHDKQKGGLSLIRVVSGNLKKGAKITSINGISEVVQKIYKPLADEYQEVTSVNGGDIAACTGLKSTVTGDFIFSNASTMRIFQSKLKRHRDDSFEIIPVDIPDEDLNDMFMYEPYIPDAVYFCSIEPPSTSFQLALDNALKQLCREDPSLKVKYDEHTGQTILGGMGQLHLEIIKSRLLSEYKIDADLGPLQIAYRETLEADIRDSILIEKVIGGMKQIMSLELSLTKSESNENSFVIDSNPDTINIIAGIRPKFLHLIRKSALSSLERGPRVGGEVMQVQIVLHNVTIGRGTADSFIMATTHQCVQKILTNGSKLLEPVMLLSIVTPADKTPLIIGDLSRRRGNILSVKSKNTSDSKIIEVVVPLAELENYTTILRTMSSGTASIVMQPHGYISMTPMEENKAIGRSQGLLQ